jgi:hypothetical protein
VATLSASTLHADLLAAGLSPAASDTLTGIAGAESSYTTTAVGDVALENAEWGPSVGIFQVRTLKSETGTGSVRDINWLQGNLAHQIQAALSISKQGTDFTPWSTYNDGAYLKFEPGGSGAAGSTDTGSTDADNASLLGGLTSGVTNDVQSIAFKAIAALLGLGLVGAGIYRLAGPQIRSATKGALTAAAV